MTPHTTITTPSLTVRLAAPTSHITHLFAVPLLTPLPVTADELSLLAASATAIAELYRHLPRPDLTSPTKSG